MLEGNVCKNSIDCNVDCSHKQPHIEEMDVPDNCPYPYGDCISRELMNLLIGEKFV